MHPRVFPVRASLAEHSYVDNLSYGDFWWRPWLNVETQHVDVIAAEGHGGQKIYLVPQYDLVAVCTAGGYNAASTPPNTMAKIVLPRLNGSSQVAVIPRRRRNKVRGSDACRDRGFL